MSGRWAARHLRRWRAAGYVRPLSLLNLLAVRTVWPVSLLQQWCETGCCAPLTADLALQAANGNGNYAAAAPYEAPTRHRPPAGRQNFAMSCDAYRREHGLVVQGASVPDPLQTFESVGFPSNIMDEVSSAA